MTDPAEPAARPLFGDPVAEPSSTAGATGTVTVDDAPATTEAAEDRGGSGGGTSLVGAPREGGSPAPVTPRLVLIGVVAVLVVGFGAFLLLRKPSGESATTVASGDAITASFATDSASSLGATDGGGNWQVLAGTWGTQGGRAKLVTADAAPRNLAVVDIGKGDGSVTATAASIQPGWGLVFRVQDRDNYTMMLAAPDFASYSFAKVTAGQVTPLGKPLGPLANVDGTIVRVDYQGPVITLSINGKPQLTVNDPAFQPATKAGILIDASASAAKARLGQFSDFAAQADTSGTPIATAVPKAGGNPAKGPDATAPKAKGAPTTAAPTAAPTTAPPTTAAPTTAPPTTAAP